MTGINSNDTKIIEENYESILCSNTQVRPTPREAAHTMTAWDITTIPEKKKKINKRSKTQTNSKNTEAIFSIHENVSYCGHYR